DHHIPIRAQTLADKRNQFRYKFLRVSGFGWFTSFLQLQDKCRNDTAVDRGLFIKPLERVFKDGLGAHPGVSKGKCGSFAKHTFHVDLTLVQLDQVLTKGKPKARPLFSCDGRSKLLELLEHLRKLLFGNP